MQTGRIFNAQVVTPERILPNGGVAVAGGRVTAVLESCREGDVDLEGCYLLPGLIDVHTHPPGDDGASPEKLAALRDELRGHGTAGFLFAPTNIPVEELLDALRQYRESLDGIGPGRGCLGLHLEGPYVDPGGRGGFRIEAITNPEDFPLDVLLGACGPWAKYINVSPELPGAVETIQACRGRGMAVSIGHTRASREELFAALDAGAGAICHAFNAGEIQRYKEGGVFDVTLDLLGLATDGLVCELICDGIHVDPVLVQLLYRAKGADGIALVTDSILGGRPASEGQEIGAGRTRYRVVNGAGRNPDGDLVGSTLTMARAVANFASFTGCGLVEAARAAALTPARLLGVEADYGAIEPGRRALFCVLDAGLEPRVDLCRRVNGIADGSEYDQR